MPIPQKHPFTPFARARRTLDDMYARIDDTIAELPATPGALQASSPHQVWPPAAVPTVSPSGHVSRSAAGVPAA